MCNKCILPRECGTWGENHLSQPVWGEKPLSHVTELPHLTVEMSVWGVTDQWWGSSLPHLTVELDLCVVHVLLCRGSDTLLKWVTWLHYNNDTWRSTCRSLSYDMLSHVQPEPPGSRLLSSIHAYSSSRLTSTRPPIRYFRTPECAFCLTYVTPITYFGRME